MTSISRQTIELLAPEQTLPERLHQYIDTATDELIQSLPSAELLCGEERRGIIARYTAVLEGNFIYWMTATYLSVHSEEAHANIEDNLRDEVRGNHPGMLHRFAAAASSTPKDLDRFAIARDLQQVRAFVSQLATQPIVLMMAFFEGFIARFMPYLGELGARQGSQDMEYTDVHGVVDVGHTQGLFQAFMAERSLHNAELSEKTLIEGIDLLRKLIETIIHPAD